MWHEMAAWRETLALRPDLSTKTIAKVLMATGCMGYTDGFGWNGSQFLSIH